MAKMQLVDPIPYSCAQALQVKSYDFSWSIEEHRDGALTTFLNSSELISQDQPNFHRASKAISTEEKESYHTSTIQKLHSFDPLADASQSDDQLPAATEDYIHIRIQQRNGRKTLTTVQGIADVYDKNKLVKASKKKFACNGTVIEHLEYEEVIKLQDDQCKNICQFLIETGLNKNDQMKVHGF
ncbi:eukaryotic translation initiation factor 1-like [Myotis myotis]|uniref:eukaryotic translation initiation factor 1-like n=1 Tax=Myotis myotis TaxID=51298 RepID=UPI00174CF0BA|nr:eukaryotic translation initiation factor 1-like [Myotis myotis]